MRIVGLSPQTSFIVGLSSAPSTVALPIRNRLFLLIFWSINSVLFGTTSVLIIPIRFVSIVDYRFLTTYPRITNRHCSALKQRILQH